MGKYDDMLHLPHHVSDKRPRMSLHDRAAQFSPFSALTGYASVIQETARLTDRRVELSEDERTALDERLRLIAASISEEPVVTITYFRPDLKKEGGAYLTVTGTVRKVREFEGVILMSDGTEIPLHDILSIQGELFPVVPQ